MIRFVFLVALVLVIAIAGGAASVWYAINEIDGFRALRVGNWTAFPERGNPEADPYSRARFARDADLPLGPAEGLAFVATVDSAGAQLDRRCTYRIRGSVPVSRFWTLYATEAARAVPREGSRPGLQSLQIVRRSDNSFDIVASPHPAPGNWLSLSGEGPMSLVLTLYDAPALHDADAAELNLPQIDRLGCDA